jgi:hypothetical protein
VYNFGLLPHLTIHFFLLFCFYYLQCISEWCVFKLLRTMRRRFNVFFFHFVVTFYILLFTTHFLNISQGNLAHIFYSIYLYILFVMYVLPF